MKEVKIGSQIWSKENLRVTTFRNGDPIPVLQENEKWKNCVGPAMCVTPEGYFLYNWEAINDERGLLPEGWHISTSDDWVELLTYLENNRIDTIFNAYSGGMRDSNGVFFNKKVKTYTNQSYNNSWFWTLVSEGLQTTKDENKKLYVCGTKFLFKNYESHKLFGLAVRCVKDLDN